MSYKAGDFINDRDTTAFGTLRSGQKIFRELYQEKVASAIPARDAIKVFFHNRQGKRIAQASSETHDNEILSCEFELTEQGCGSATIELANMPTFDLDLGSYVDIHMFQSATPWYSGVLMEVPIRGHLPDDDKIELKVFGFFQYLEDLVIREGGITPTVFNSTNVATVAYNLAAYFMAPKINVGLNPHKIDQVDHDAAELDFQLETVKSAIDDVADLAQDHVYGIDASREFFFRRRIHKAQSHMTFFPTHDVKDIEVTRNLDGVVNALYIKSGTSGRYTTEKIWYYENTDSIREYGRREKKISLPTLVSTTDVDRYGAWYLDMYGDPEETVSFQVTRVSTQIYLPGHACRIYVEASTKSISDEFSDANIDVAWTSVQTTGFAMVETGGVLRCFPGTATAASSPCNVPYIYKRVVGDFVVDVSLDGYAGVPSSPALNDAAGIHLRGNSPFKRTEIVRTRTNASPAQWRYERRDILGSSIYVSDGGTLTTVDPIILRLTRLSDGGIRTYFGTDTDSLVEVPSAATDPFSTARPVNVGMTAYLDEAGWFPPTTPYYDFEYFRLARKGIYYDLPTREVKYRVEGHKMGAKIVAGYQMPNYGPLVEGLKEGKRLYGLWRQRDRKIEKYMQFKYFDQEPQGFWEDV